MNIEHDFEGDIDWNFIKEGKLWTFNLNYFDFLNQENITETTGLWLIKDYISKHSSLIEGKESYTISLRGINWVRFLSKHKVEDSEINQTLYNDYYRLYKNLELHFLGNHYIENGYSLLFGAYYFKDDNLYKCAKKILIEQLDEQILKDGAHFELSPMYHQTMLHRVLDCFNLTIENTWKDHELSSFLMNKAEKMLAWLEKVTYLNGDIPMVNDSAYGIAPESKQLFAYAKSLGISWDEATLYDSGYRKIETQDYELFMDMGEVGASYLPAHVHSDTFNFELRVNGKPIIVDLGTSTYEKNALRQSERSTASHNTVKIGDIEQTEVWGGFRAANRARIIKLNESENTVEATHDGYKKIGVLHTRKFLTNTSSIIINDILSNSPVYDAKAYFHFHPSVEIIRQDNNSIKLVNEDIKITFSEEVYKINIVDYNFAQGFNRTIQSKKIEVFFDKILSTHIDLKK